MNTAVGGDNGKGSYHVEVFIDCFATVLFNHMIYVVEDNNFEGFWAILINLQLLVQRTTVVLKLKGL